MKAGMREVQQKLIAGAANSGVVPEAASQAPRQTHPAFALPVWSPSFLFQSDAGLETAEMRWSRGVRAQGRKAERRLGMATWISEQTGAKSRRAQAPGRLLLYT